MVLAVLEGRSPLEVARQHKTTLTTVRKWVTRFGVSGAGGLEDRPRSGRPSVLASTVFLRWAREEFRNKATGGMSNVSVRNLARTHGLPRSTVHRLLVAARSDRERE